MRLRLVLFLMGLSSIVSISPAYAHINGSHSMSLVGGLQHLFTEPTHIFLLLPAIVTVLFLLLRKHMRKSGRED